MPVREAIQIEYVDQLLGLVEDSPASVASSARARLESLERALPSARSVRAGSRDHRVWLARQISAGLAAIDRGEEMATNNTSIPPGSPIGAANSTACWHCDSASMIRINP